MKLLLKRFCLFEREQSEGENEWGRGEQRERKKQASALGVEPEMDTGIIPWAKDRHLTDLATRAPLKNKSIKNNNSWNDLLKNT